jgi:hypothetical protein
MDKYDKGVLLGRGTFASVYKAIHKEVRRLQQHSSSRASRHLGLHVFSTSWLLLGCRPARLWRSRRLTLEVRRK